MRIIRYIFCICNVLACCLIFVACNTTVYYEGIENFNKNQSDFELNLFILPSDDFLEKFVYEDIDYYYKNDYKSSVSLWGNESSIIIADYNSNIYDEAKNYCINKMRLSSYNTIQYNEYTFIENLQLAEGQEALSNGENVNYPYLFNMFAYNDIKHCLIFMGFCAEDFADEQVENLSENWGDFLKEYFGEFYDFE